ncbi:MAG: hypothetical protein V4787_19365 [Pseudomonadota bacterium]
MTLWRAIWMVLLALAASGLGVITVGALVFIWGMHPVAVIFPLISAGWALLCLLEIKATLRRSWDESHNIPSQ